MRQATFSITKEVKNGYSFYRIYAPAYLNPTGKGGYIYFHTRADAERKRGEMLAATRTKSKVATLSNAQATDATRALERLAENGLSHISLDRAIEAALPLLRSLERSVTVEQLFRNFVEAKKRSWRPATLRAFNTSSKIFLRRFGGRLIASIDADELEAWYETSFSTDGYRAHEIRTIRPAFTWAKRRRLLQDSPYAFIERVNVKRHAIAIYTPKQAEAIMHACPPDCVAAYALLLFAGVRPKELTQLKWGDIRDGYIHITPAVAKTWQVRNIEAEPTLAAWLTSTGKHAAEELVCPPNWVRKGQAIRAAAGVPVMPDAPRHSYASYHLAIHRDIAGLKNNLGHSPNSDTLFAHYRAAALPSDAQQYWNILPNG